jgi:hypothetical protein
MTNANRAPHVEREAIMNLLSSEEIARVSNAEAAAHLKDGEEYLDLLHLNKGVLRATATLSTSIGQLLPRSAVHGDTWTKILAKIVH